MQQIYRRTNMLLSVISLKLQSNFIEITLRHGCSNLNLLHIFRTSFPKNTLESCFYQYLNPWKKHGAPINGNDDSDEIVRFQIFQTYLSDLIKYGPIFDPWNPVLLVVKLNIYRFRCNFSKPFRSYINQRFELSDIGNKLSQ